MGEIAMAVSEPDEQADAENVVVDSSIVLKVSASQDADVRDSVVGALVAGDDLRATGCIGSAYVAGRDLNLKEGKGKVLVVGNSAMVDHSTVGILVGGSDVSFTGGSKLVITMPVALMMVVVTGGMIGVAAYLLHREKRKLIYNSDSLRTSSQ